MEGTEKYRRTFEKFEKAFSKFREIKHSPELFEKLSDEFLIEIATKRFEYTFEALWKCLQQYFRHEGINCSTPLKSFQESFKANLIREKDEEIFSQMIEKRNQIVHVYDLDHAAAIFEFIKKEEILDSFDHIYKKLKDI